MTDIRIRKIDTGAMVYFNDHLNKHYSFSRKARKTNPLKGLELMLDDISTTLLDGHITGKKYRVVEEPELNELKRELEQYKDLIDGKQARIFDPPV